MPKKLPAAETKSLKKAAIKKLPPAKAPPKIGLPTQLAAIQARYRRAMMAVHHHPDHEQGGLIHAAVSTMLTEKAALGVKDGEEAVAVSGD